MLGLGWHRRKVPGGGGGGSDPEWSNVVFLSGFDGTDGSTTASDDSNSAHALVFGGTAALDTAAAKFGSSSLFVNPYVTVGAAGHEDFQFGSGQFTVEGFFFRSVSYSTSIVMANYDSSTGWALRINGSAIDFMFHRGTLDSVSYNYTLPNDAFYHIAVDRDAAHNLRLYLNGAMVAKKTYASGFTMTPSAALLNLGQYPSGTSKFQGWIDEPRITKGVARYASDAGFEVPTEAFPRG